MPDTVIDHVNLLGADQPDLPSFADHRGPLIANSVVITGVDSVEYLATNNTA